MFNHLKRLSAIIYNFTKFFKRAFISKLKKEPVQKRATLLRQTLEHLGSVFIKFSQFLSLETRLNRWRILPRVFLFTRTSIAFSQN
jgi:predicted unusual protein kinase regulating ubiquinone biosynthesis (AarF/ABC1/UbiB family)